MESRRANYVENSMPQVELQWEVHRTQCIWCVARNGGGVLGSPWSSPYTLWSVGLEVFPQGPVILAARY